MRRLDIGFALLAVALVATLGWWWAGRYASEREALVDRVDLALESWRADQLRRTVAAFVADAKAGVDDLEVATELIAVSPGVKVDLERDRVIQIDRSAMSPADSVATASDFPEELTRVLGDGFALGASDREVGGFLDGLAERLGVVLELRGAKSAGGAPAPGTASEPAGLFAGPALVIAASGPRGAQPAPTSYVAIEDYRGMLLRRVAPEIGVGLALLLGLGGFYAVVRGDLRRRTRALAEKDRFIANVAHELKTPIAVVGVALEALEDFGADADPERRRRYLRTSREELGRLALLAERALGTLQLESEGIRPLTREPVDLVDLAADSWQTLALKHGFSGALGGACAKTDNAATDNAATDNAATVPGDPQLLRHLLDNLLDNAIKYGADPAGVYVQFVANRKTCTLRVVDDGPGIPVAMRERVFEKFYRLHRAGEGHRIKGHGLGLSYAREIVRRHGGSIRIGAGPGGAGAEVTVQLPRS